MLPLVKPVRVVTKLGRQPVASFATVETFDGKPFESHPTRVDRSERKHRGP
jgi:hypothetical protein